MEVEAIPREYVQFGEILMFSCFAIREMINLGKSEGGGLLPFALRQVGTRPSPSLGKDALAPVLVPFDGISASKRFLGHLTAREHIQFYLKIKGFGILGRGLDYYGPTAVLMLFQYLVEKRKTEQGFIDKLGSAAKLCAEARLMGRLSLLNQNEMASQIASLANSSPE